MNCAVCRYLKKLEVLVILNLFLAPRSASGSTSSMRIQTLYVVPVPVCFVYLICLFDRCCQTCGQQGLQAKCSRSAADDSNLCSSSWCQLCAVHTNCFFRKGSCAVTIMFFVCFKYLLSVIAIFDLLQKK